MSSFYVEGHRAKPLRLTGLLSRPSKALSLSLSLSLSLFLSLSLSLIKVRGKSLPRDRSVVIPSPCAGAALGPPVWIIPNKAPPPHRVSRESFLSVFLSLSLSLSLSLARSLARSLALSLSAARRANSWFHAKCCGPICANANIHSRKSVRKSMRCKSVMRYTLPFLPFPPLLPPAAAPPPPPARDVAQGLASPKDVLLGGFFLYDGFAHAASSS